MSSLVQVAFHHSQFPETISGALLESLRTRQVDHRFHYDSLKQTQQWLAVHQAYSPSRTDPDCAAVYERSFAAAAAGVVPRRVHLVGLGCGGGRKDARLLQELLKAGHEAFYTPVDVSTAMVLVARQMAVALVPPENCSPLVCDLGTAQDLPAVLADPPEAVRVLTFFGMLPNFEPQIILPQLARLVRPGDALLLSANLAPGPDYEAGVRRILPLYDNAPTRDWLMTFLLDLGVEKGDGELRFRVEEGPAPWRLKRVAAYFHFARLRQIRVESHRFEFAPGERIRLFFSCRHTPELVAALLDQHGLRVTEQWVTQSGEEGVFLAARS